MTDWTEKAIFYHIYPLGACAAPTLNPYSHPTVPRLRRIMGWLEHIQALGCNAIYLGPVFESGTHGYDTANYYEIDRRLGERSDLADLSQALHARGMHLVLDGVFNHVGRDFWAFRNVLEKGQGSPYVSWFSGLRFDGRSPYGDPFTYEAWNGHYSLVKLNLSHPEVREHLFGAVRMWVEEFKIDGIRLDAADSLSFEFMQALRQFSSTLKPDLWLMGEVIHGDYRRWVNPETLHATTNYELYKSLYSSHNDRNYFELAYSLNRGFGNGGMYQGLNLYNFVDNHDVSRISSQLNDAADLYPLHILLYSVPGIPSIYYGSEFGFRGVKSTNDWGLRPEFKLEDLLQTNQQSDLRSHISHLAEIRSDLLALQKGSYEQKLVAPGQLAFVRTWADQQVLVIVNSEAEAVRLRIPMEGMAGWKFSDRLNGNEVSMVSPEANLEITLPAKWGRILVSTY